MRPVLLALIVTISMSAARAQFFVPQLPDPLPEGQSIIMMEDVYVVKNNGDTISGKLSGVNGTIPDLRHITFKIAKKEKIRVMAEEIKTLAILPGPFITTEGGAVVDMLKGLENEAFAAALPEGDWMFFERQRLPQKREYYQFMQLLNPGFDSKIKVYAHPEAESTGGLTGNGIQLTGSMENIYYVSVGGANITEIQQLGYRKKALAELYNNCEVIGAIDKLKWKDFPKHVFAHHQECE